MEMKHKGIHPIKGEVATQAALILVQQLLRKMSPHGKSVFTFSQ